MRSLWVSDSSLDTKSNLKKLLEAQEICGEHFQKIIGRFISNENDL